MTKKTKIAIVGSGGVGGYFGGLLAKTGMNVHFLARGEHLAAIKEKGLTIKSWKGDFNVKVNANEEPESIGECDIILFCIKSFDTKDMAEKIKSLVGPSTIIISLQNGVENEEIIGKILGEKKVMGGVAFIGSRIKGPGIILHTAAGSLTFGEMTGGTSERGDNLLRIFREAGIEAKQSENIKKTMWQKMVWNCGFNAITALSGCTVKEALSVSETRDAIKKSMDEVVAVAKELNIILREDLPEKTIAHSEKQGEVRTSMLVDLESGRRVEIDILNGAVSRLGKKLAIATPINDTLFGLLKAINMRKVC